MINNLAQRVRWRAGREGAPRDVERPEWHPQDNALVPKPPLTNPLRARNPPPHFRQNPTQNKTETPTLSRGRPALPVYRQGVTVRGMSILAVDNSAAVDNSGVGR
jgi:hypothetical protein